MVQKTYFKTKDYCKVKFSFVAESAEKIQLLGLNNDWQTPIEMKKRKDGLFVAEIKLDKGSRHEFKYLVNETEWLMDDQADATTNNVYGSQNSVVII